MLKVVKVVVRHESITHLHTTVCVFKVTSSPEMKRAIQVLFILQLLFLLLESVDVERNIQGSDVNRDIEGKNVWGHHHNCQRKFKKRSYLNTSLNGNNNEQTCLKNNMWFVWNNKTKSCQCGDDINRVVECNAATNTLSVRECYCLTLDHTMQSHTLAVVGNCILNCVNSSTFLEGIDVIYHSAPTDCASLNRQGTLCGQCLDGYTVPAYSYEFKCIRCDSELENWGLYIVFAFVPLTVFIVIILVFRINVLSPKLNMFVIAAQNVSIPILLRIVLYGISLAKFKFTVLSLATLYGIWNLDFFRINVLPDVCINVIPLHVLVLDYLIAIYPMLLMAVAYTIVELYGFGFRPLLYMWKPFHYFFARFRRQWGIQTTIMDAFVTFFFLSTTKLLSVSCDLLIGTALFTSDGKLYSWNLYYDPSIEYFGREHLPYALLAIGILTVFIAFPTSLLLFYQCKVYRKCLEKCYIKGRMLDEFVNNFQKYYKDGSNGTWDCRWFAGFLIVIKSLGYVTYAVSLNDISYILFMMLSTVTAALILTVEPYTEEYEVFNTISPNVFLWLALVFASFVYKSNTQLSQTQLNDHYITASIFGLFPLVYIIVVIIHHLIRRFRGEKGGDELTSSLPHRLLHSDQYR